ncbi:hypothetical protein KC343_g6812 [Hortaea werneckii]|uniref:Phosphoribulokinase/uridine kinase domain-containing protein n=1 Tax=Hortaea werneckii TaxID=91943 RepID=A0A3M7EUW4_HORWE|nr:hypothetical protein KC338_g2180 [Hortaea werneckii]KAI7278088.1 hypothetical protein KC352_g7576 [Hortaea werneckii]KAI7570235.1 hypothetical protein KC317_g2639 [Hortaea werneckii]KAI7624405.1 hypothetical protein KC346_g2226 [Hortaea werneckii]KAI7624911.1 hypothetical protein KC343_g6812 [Hortaea werneckii]
MKNDEFSTRLANRVAQHYQRLPSVPDNPRVKTKRCLVALAGGPGSGKSTIASAIADKVCKQGIKCQVVSIEGFMKPKSALRSEEEVRKRGTIESFDGDAVVDMFKRLRELGPGHELWAPSFDEAKADPVPESQLIEADSQAVIFEGIYLLADVEPWNQIEHLVDEKWFIHVRPELCRERVAGRRVDKGFSKDMREALESYDEFDGRNNDFIGRYRYQTDLIIESNEELGIREPDGEEIK